MKATVQNKSSLSLVLQDNHVFSEDLELLPVESDNPTWITQSERSKNNTVPRVKRGFW